MRMLKKIIRKLYHLIWFLSLFFVVLLPVNAEIETGEQFSEFATHKTGLMRLFFQGGDFALYAYNWAGHTPTLDDFLSGRQYLVRYENNTNDTYGSWAIRPWNPTGVFPVGTYLMTWRVDMETAQARNDIMNGTVTAVNNGVINSVSITSNNNSVYFLVNFTLNVATDTPRFEISSRISANWFLRMVDNCYYPQITPSVYYDTSQLEQQQNIIISQNQQMIDTYKQQNEWTRDEIRNQTDTIEQQGEWTRDEIRNVDGTLKDETAPNLDLSDLEVSSDTPISDLITMPLTILNTLIQTLDGSCTNYTIPFFYSNTLTFPCFTISDYFGSTVTNYIDLFICFYMCYNIAMLVVSVFEDITSLRDIYDSMYVPKHAESGYQPKHAKGGGN